MILFINRYLFLALLAALLLTTPAHAQITRRIPDQDQTATAVVQDGSSVWVGTPVGAYRVDGDSVTRVPDFKLDIRSISVIDGTVWLATTQGAYRVKGDRAVRVPDQGLVVTSIVKVGSRIWLATAKGAYLVDGDTAKRTPDVDYDVAAIVPIDGTPWLATDRGAFALTPASSPLSGAEGVGDRSAFTAKHLVNIDYDLNQIVEIDNVPWLATDQGAFRIDPTGPKHIQLISPADPSFRFTGKQAEVFHIVKAGGKIWFIGRPGAFRVDGDVSHRIPDIASQVASITDGPHNDVWIATRTGAYRVTGDTVRRIPDQPLDVAGITVVDGRVWLATSTGAYVVDGDSARREPDQPLSVSSIVDAGGNALLSTSEGAIVVDRDNRSYHVLSGAAVLGTQIAGGNVWLSTSAGSFQVDTDDRLHVRLVPVNGGWEWERRLLPAGWVVAGDYRLNVMTVNAQTGSVQPVPDALVALGSGDFQSPATVRLHLAPGARRVDAYAKIGWTPPISVDLDVVAVPAWLVPMVSLLVVWIALGLIIFLAAPFSTAAWSLTMHRHLRGIGSLWLVSLLLATGPGRRYFLARYRRGLRDALGPEPAGESLSLEWTGQKLASTHLAHVAVTPLSEPFVTACSIARRALDHDVDLGPAAKSTPAPILVSGNEVERLDSLIIQLLAYYGQMTDRSLAKWLVEKGRWLLILEGDAGSTLQSDRSKPLVEAFVARYGRNNHICIVRPDV